MSTEPTIIQLPDGRSYGTTMETPAEAAERLAEDWIVQRIGNVVRMVGPIRRELRWLDT